MSAGVGGGIGLTGRSVVVLHAAKNADANTRLMRKTPMRPWWAIFRYVAKRTTALWLTARNRLECRVLAAVGVEPCVSVHDEAAGKLLGHRVAELALDHICSHGAESTNPTQMNDRRALPLLGPYRLLRRGASRAPQHFVEQFFRGVAVFSPFPPGPHFS